MIKPGPNINPRTDKIKQIVDEKEQEIKLQMRLAILEAVAKYRALATSCTTTADLIEQFAENEAEKILDDHKAGED